VLASSLFVLITVGVGSGCAAGGPDGGSAAPVPLGTVDPSRSPSGVSSTPASPVPAPLPAAALIHSLSPATAVPRATHRTGSGSGSTGTETAGTGAAPAHFRTLRPGSALPSDAQCAAWVRATPSTENKRMNVAANRTTGQRLAPGFFPPADDSRANTRIASRVDGAFAGSTRQILRWTACKWGIDEDVVYAQAAVESWWRQTTKGDYHTDPTRCPPGHPLGADGQSGTCPQSYGILQNRYPFERSAWPGAERSTAMNTDTAYAVWRACFEGYERWLNTVEHGGPYAAGDLWGCVGRWFSGRWHLARSESYIAHVQGTLSQRIWQTADFQEP
jgi:autotransporter family porin